MNIYYRSSSIYFEDALTFDYPVFTEISLVPINLHGLQWAKKYCNISSFKCKIEKELLNNTEEHLDKVSEYDDIVKIKLQPQKRCLSKKKKQENLIEKPFIESTYSNLCLTDKDYYLPGISIVDNACLIRTEICKNNNNTVEKLQFGSKLPTKLKLESSECSIKHLGDRFGKVEVHACLSKLDRLNASATKLCLFRLWNENWSNSNNSGNFEDISLLEVLKNSSTWMSVICENDIYGNNVRRELELQQANYISNNESFYTGIWKLKQHIYDDPSCYKSLYQLIVKGDYYVSYKPYSTNPMMHMFEFSSSTMALIPKNQEFIQKLESGLRDSGGFDCGRVSNWQIDTEYDLTTTMGCNLLGLSVPMLMKYVIQPRFSNVHIEEIMIMPSPDNQSVVELVKSLYEAKLMKRTEIKSNVEVFEENWDKSIVLDQIQNTNSSIKNLKNMTIYACSLLFLYIYMEMY